MMINTNSKAKLDLDSLENPLLGLIENQSRGLIPLKLIDALIEIEENYAKVSLTHHYTNSSDQVIDCSFNFPKTDEAVFYSLNVKQGEKEIIAIVDSKNKARAKYEESAERGETCVLTEVGDKFLANVVTTKIGNFMPGENMIVTYSYLEKLSVSMNKFFKFILPATLTQRFTSNNEKNSSKNAGLMNQNNFALKEKNSYEFSDEFKNSKICYLKGEDIMSHTWNVKAIINSSCPISNIKISSGHPVFIEYNSDSKKAYVSLDTSKSKLPNGDFVLLLENIDLLSPKVKLFRHPQNFNDYALNISFNPIYLACQNEYKKLINNNEKTHFKIKNEEEFLNIFTKKLNETDNFKGSFLFFIDRSGSMANDRIRMAKRALKIILKSLSLGSSYNIISFGSKYQQMYSKLIEANDEHINESIANVNKFQANMGGTELLDAIKNTVLECQEISKEKELRVFVLTDGAIGNTEEVLDFVKTISENQRIRFYSLGIGNGCSFDLVNGIANYGGGLCEFAESENLITEKTVYLLESSMKPKVFKFHLTTDDLDITEQLIKNDIQKNLRKNYMLGQNFELISRFDLANEKLSEVSIKFNYCIELPAIFQDDVLESNSNKDLTEITVKLNLHEAEVSNVFHKIWANAYCKENQKDIETAVKYSILYRKTALFCVVKENELTEEQLRKKRQIDIQSQTPIDYGIKVYVKTLTGKTLSILCESSETVLFLKDKVEDEEEIPSDHQLMVFNGMQLENSKTLNHYKIKNHSTVHLVLRLRASEFEYKAKVFYNDNFLFDYISRDYFMPLVILKLESLKRIPEFKENELTFLSESREILDSSQFRKKIPELEGQIGNVIYIYDITNKEDMRLKAILNDEAVIVEMQKMSGEWVWDLNVQKAFAIDDPDKIIKNVQEKFSEYKKIIENEDSECIKNAIFTLFMKVFLEKRFSDKISELKLILAKADGFIRKHLLENYAIKHIEIIFNSKVEELKLY